MSFTNVLSVGMATSSEGDLTVEGFSSSTVGRLFMRLSSDTEFDADTFCSGDMDTEFTSALSVTSLGEC